MELSSLLQRHYSLVDAMKAAYFFAGWRPSDSEAAAALAAAALSFSDDVVERDLFPIHIGRRGRSRGRRATKKETLH
jgi:hypothetical protein